MTFPEHRFRFRISKVPAKQAISGRSGDLADSDIERGEYDIFMS